MVLLITATYHLLYGDVNLINTEIEIYRSISHEEIRDVAKKYLNPNQRLVWIMFHLKTKLKMDIAL
jgi:predicted Zn-dependent peptidase